MAAPKGIFGALAGKETPVESCDYLVIGAGCVGMAFSDALVAATKGDRVVIVDSRAHPGGHWNDAYSFSHGYWYGGPAVTCGPAGDGSSISGDRPDGWEVATGRDVLNFFEDIMEGLLKTGRVQYLPMCKCTKDGVIVSLLDPDLTWKMEVRKRIVDARYSGVTVPLTHKPNFHVEPGATVIPVSGLSQLNRPASKFVVLGAGKTAMDAVRFLLRSGVNPKKINWVIPRNTWLYHTDVHKNHMASLSAWMGVLGDAIHEVASKNGSVEDVYRVLHSWDRVLPLDPSDEPTMYRCVTSSTDEYALMSKVHSGIIRLGRVRSVGVESLHLEKGSIKTGPGVVHIDCSAQGQPPRPILPIWGKDQITCQPVTCCNQALGAALLGHIEALYGTKEQDEVKNMLCRPVQPAFDLRSFVVGFGQQRTNIVNCGKDARIKDFLMQNRLFIHPDAVPSLVDTMGPMETSATAEDIDRVLAHDEALSRNFHEAVVIEDEYDRGQQSPKPKNPVQHPVPSSQISALSTSGARHSKL